MRQRLKKLKQLRNLDQAIEEAKGTKTSLESSVELVRNQLTTFQSKFTDECNGEAMQNARATYGDHGNWARHYSTVRLGGTTFFFGLALALLGQESQTQEKLIVSGILALIGVVLFWAFSKATEKRMTNQFKDLIKMGVRKDEPDRHWAYHVPPILVFALVLVVGTGIAFSWKDAKPFGTADSEVPVAIWNAETNQVTLVVDGKTYEATLIELKKPVGDGVDGH